jgi:hypothetical protein
MLLSADLEEQFTTTAAPAALKPLAVAAPMRFDAPVTTATSPFKSLRELLAKKSAGPTKALVA